VFALERGAAVADARIVLAPRPRSRASA
jgi:hypothetical protein